MSKQKFKEQNKSVRGNTMVLWAKEEHMNRAIVSLGYQQN